MGAAVALAFFIIAVCGIAQSAIAINAYLTANKPKDVSFNFSVFVMVASILMLFGSGYSMYRGIVGTPAPVAAAEPVVENAKTE